MYLPLAQQWLSLVEQELLTLLGQLSSLPVFTVLWHKVNKSLFLLLKCYKFAGKQQIPISVLLMTRTWIAIFKMYYTYNYCNYYIT
jgi:hypothetical protein